MTDRPRPGPEAEGEGTWRGVALLGFMASGKSVVGRALAARLGWAHVDLDAEIERLADRSIAEIFAAGGEAAFRELEVRTTPRVLAIDHLVLSTGGGWVTNPGLFESLPADTLTVWLKVSPETVTQRLAASRNQAIRPLLRDGASPDSVRALLARRESLYARARACIETDELSVADVAAEVAALVRAGNGGTGDG